MKYPQLERLIEIVATLRSENGCQWDREQTHRSLRPNMLEEAYEAVDAIDDGNIENLREELGDVLLQVVLHSQIAKDEGEFDIEDVAKELSDKLIHRHPHVFGDAKVNSTSEILEAWDRLKKEEKINRKSVLDGVDSLKKCIESEYREFEEAVETGEFSKMEDEMGDIFFATVNLARWYKIDAEQALLRANKKFTKRFKKMEEIADKPLEEYSYEEFDKLWKRAKSLTN